MPIRSDKTVISMGGCYADCLTLTKKIQQSMEVRKNSRETRKKKYRKHSANTRFVIYFSHW